MFFPAIANKSFLFLYPITNANINKTTEKI